MKVMLVDDDKKCLAQLEKITKELLPKAEIISFDDSVRDTFITDYTSDSFLPKGQFVGLSIYLIDS